MTKKTKIIILVSMVLLLAVTTTLNIVFGVLNKKDSPTASGGTNLTGNQNFFESTRSVKTSSRDAMMLEYDKIINNEALKDTEAKNTAALNKAKLQELIASEAELEVALKATKLYDDIIVTMYTDSDMLDVFVKKANFEDKDVTNIIDVVVAKNTKVDRANVNVHDF